MSNKHFISRRNFLKRTGCGAAAAAIAGLPACSTTPQTAEAGPIPKRRLGKTDLETTILAFGGGSQFLLNKNGKWEPMIQRALDAGINFYDTADNYTWGDGMTSEQRFGEILPAYKDRVIVTTKFDARTRDGARKAAEASFEKLKMDSVDILMLHSIEETDTPSVLEKGAYTELAKMRDEGMARYIGFSCMNTAERAAELLEEFEFDVVLLAMNPTLYGGFAKLVMPVARRKNVGVLSMKIMRDIVGVEATAKELLDYAWMEEGVSSVCIAHNGMPAFEQNLSLAQRFKPTQAIAANRNMLENRHAHLAGPHALCWARSDYRDGGLYA